MRDQLAIETQRGNAVDAAVPPRIVFDSPAACTDRDRAEALLRLTVGAARTPPGSWIVSMRIDPAASGGLRAQGTIANAEGTLLAHRELAESGAECRGLARAVGVWASLVLDAARDREPSSAAGTSPPPQETASVSNVGVQATADAPDLAAKGGLPASNGVPALPPWPGEPPAAEKTSEPERPGPRFEEHTGFELGVGAFLMSGTGGGPVAGATPFAFFEIAPGVHLRPSIGIGQNLGWLRVDTCMRVQGRYSNRHGLQLDVCGGADLVVYYAWAARPDTIGPSVDLRGELGSDLAIALRAIFGLNAASRQGLSDSNIDSSLWSGRAELALSWGVR